MVRKRPTYANVLSTISVFLALGRRCLCVCDPASQAGACCAAALPRSLASCGCETAAAWFQPRSADPASVRVAIPLRAPTSAIRPIRKLPLRSRG
jgi:hypothetical protein